MFDLGGNLTHDLRIRSPLLYRLSYEARWEQVVGDYGGICTNVNVKGTNECCEVSTNDVSEN